MRFDRTRAAAGVALVLLAVGLLTVVTSSEAWFAYAPLSEEVPYEMEDLVVWTRQQAVGAVLVAAALVLLAAVAGFVAGQRRAVDGT